MAEPDGYAALDGTQARQAAVYATNELRAKMGTLSMNKQKPIAAAEPVDGGYTDVAQVNAMLGRKTEKPPEPPQRQSRVVDLSASVYQEPVISTDAQGTYEEPVPVARGDGIYYSEPVVQQRLEDTVRRDIDKEDADRILKQAGLRNGTYIFRHSRSHPGSFVLCVAADGDVKHYPVALCDIPHEGMLAVLCPGPRRRFKDLAEVVSYYSQQADGIATKLTARIA